MKINLNLLSRDDMRKVFGGNSLDDNPPQWCQGECNTKFDCSDGCDCIWHPSGNYKSCRG